MKYKTILNHYGCSEVYRSNLKQYFDAHPKYFDSYINIVCYKEYKKQPISLNLIEWFIGEYSRKNKKYNPYHIGYKKQLQIHNKHYFDPICRKDKNYDMSYEYEYKPGHSVFVTIKQLNFFRWGFEIGLFDIIIRNYGEIKTEYKKYTTANKKKKK